ncbi:hypothetical protein ABH924_004354 [Arthrobacter sp. GAS37]|uniref:hypothetical protein n=1 Tax=Arthrobacter sp. GAS37 TaxID=3156261 RepID=UPI0038388375
MTEKTSPEAANSLRQAANPFARDPRNRHYRPLSTLVDFRTAAHVIYKLAGIVLVVLLAAGLALVGVYYAVRFGFTEHGLDPAVATSLGAGVVTALEHLNPVIVVTAGITLAAMLACDVLTKIIRTRQATPLYKETVTTPTTTQEPGQSQDPSTWDTLDPAHALSNPSWEIEHHPELGRVIRIDEERYLPILNKDGRPVLAFIGPTREGIAAAHRRVRQENP